MIRIKTFESSDITSAKMKGENLKHEIETYKVWVLSL